MPGPKRTQTQRENHYVIETDMYLKGYSQYAIAQKISISVQQVGKDLRDIRQRWMEKSSENIKEIIEIQLKKYDLLEAELWSAWEKSKANSDYGAYCGYIDRILSCIEQRCKLLSLYAPQSHKVEVSQVKQLSDEEMMNIIEQKVYGLLPQNTQNIKGEK